MLWFAHSAIVLNQIGEVLEHVVSRLQKLKSRIVDFSVSKAF